MDWTPERVDLLKRRYADGLSGNQVAAELGITRNAAMGKLKRLGLLGGRRGASRPGWERPRVSRASPRPRRPAPIGERNGRIARDREMLRRFQDGPGNMARHVDNSAALEIANGHCCSILELTADKCHFPIGDPKDQDFAFCGNPAEPGGPYCPGHARLAYA